jgi:basic membrane protein A
MIFEVKNDGVGLGKIGPAGTKYEAQVMEVLDKIKSGEITDIPTEVK